MYEGEIKSHSGKGSKEKKADVFCTNENMAIKPVTSLSD
jgi:hypothetical protein